MTPGSGPSTVSSTLTASKDQPNVPPARQARLCIVAPRALHGVLVLDEASVTFGRASEEDVVRVDHGTISRRHLTVAEVSDGTYSVTDLGSRNGTWVNGVAVGSLPRILKHGDVLRMGEVLAVFEVGEVLDAVEPDDDAHRIPGQSLGAMQLRACVVRAARSGGTTLIEGESGTGKEFVAAELHRLSQASGPYVVANCAALSSSLIDSQLFGHERGAFTGAVSAHEGFFRAANGGTLFLDEIGELPQDLQPKLLRAVELGEIIPLGGTKVHQVRTRVVAATNRTLDTEVAAGRFRRDLFARLTLQRIEVPPLRERRADFMVWYDLLHQRWSERQSGLAAEPVEFTAEALEALLLQPWLENLRGLDQVVHGVGGLLLTAGSKKVSVADVRAWLQTVDANREPDEAGLAEHKPPKPTREEFIAVMEAEGWSVRGTARHFARDRRQIYRWIRLFGVIRPEGSVDD